MTAALPVLFIVIEHTKIPVHVSYFLSPIYSKSHHICKGELQLCQGRPGMHPHFANVVSIAISRRRELWYVDSYLGMLDDTEKDRQCSPHGEIEYGCHLNDMEI